MYEWHVERCDAKKLKQTLNSLQEGEWEIFSILPTITFEQKKVVMQTVSLPSDVMYDVVVRKPK